MITVKEFLDIPTIQKMRLEVLGKDLDERDNFSLHIAATNDDGKVLGVARLYKTEYGITIDNIAVPTTEDFFTRDLLQRTMILRAINLTENEVTIYDNSPNLYVSFGFVKESEGKFVQKSQKIKFTHNCSCCKK